MLSPDNLDKLIFYLLLLFLPTQLGLHLWPDFSFVHGIRIDYLSPTIYFTDFLIVILFLICLIKKKFKLRVNIYFAFFFSLLFVSSLLASNYKEAFYGLIKFSEFSFLAYYVYKNIKVDQLFLKIFSIGILTESLIAFVEFLNKSSIGGIFYFLGERSFNSSTPNIANANINGELILRPYATFSHPNVLGAFLLIGISFILFFAKPKNNLERLLFYAAVFIGSLGLTLTLSRASLFGLSLLIIFKLILQLKNRSIKYAAFLLITIASVVIFALPYFNRFTSFNFSDESFVQRKDLTIAAASMIKDNPVFGIGINNFLTELPNYYRSNKTFYLQPVHNIFLLTFAQIGLIAGVMFIIFLFKTFSIAPKDMKFILFFVFFLGFFDHYFLTLQQGQILFALIIGLCFVKPNLVK